MPRKTGLILRSPRVAAVVIGVRLLGQGTGDRTVRHGWNVRDRLWSSTRSTSVRRPSRTMGSVHYCVLGTTRALRDDGTAVTLGGARLRALLTVLALRPGRTVPAGHLVDEVWDGDPPADAAGALQALVGRLRRALGRGAVESVAGGYRLAAPPDAVDLHRFERLAGEGSRALED
ncbi:LOW QUALITY PROTEIN: multidomain-containing protein family, partial [Streptomyces filamentosus NRRL 11379]